jgi:Na+-translocating ferredoxin:NAD+ oxidoreductase RnfC subunit
MNPEEITFSVDATYHLMVHEGETIKRGQCICEAPTNEAECTCPASGIIRNIRFDPDSHCFLISISEIKRE